VYREDANIHVFENPETKTTHILREEPKDFVAKAYCGYQMHAREGDLVPYDGTIHLDTNEGPTCRSCMRNYIIEELS